jgi:hypothetical protein
MAGNEPITEHEYFEFKQKYEELKASGELPVTYSGRWGADAARFINEQTDEPCVDVEKSEDQDDKPQGKTVWYENEE